MGKKDKKRIFISIDLPDGVKRQIRTQQNEQIRWVRWLETKNMHITLNFLGDLREFEINEVIKTAKQTASEFSPFSIILNRLKPKHDMLWLMPENTENIYYLHKDLKFALKDKKIGKPERRRYDPHVLIARSKKPGRKMRKIIDLNEPLEFTADSIHIYSSELTPGSATHTLIESVPLG